MSDFKTAALKAVQERSSEDGRNIFEIVMRLGHDMNIDDESEVVRVAQWAGGHLALQRHAKALEAKGKPASEESLKEAKRRIDRQFTISESASRQTPRRRTDRTLKSGGGPKPTNGRNG